METRQCKKCKSFKNLTEEFWMLRKSRFGYKCRKCENQDCKNYHFKNHDKMLKRLKDYKNNHQKEIQDYRDKNKLKMKEYRLKNKQYFREYFKNRQRKKRLDPIYKLHSNISRGINHHLKGACIKKNKSWLKYVDFTLEQLKLHLESKFSDGMNWENYGKWHIDHIKPKSLFKINSPESIEFKKCWSLDNLQPLWAIDNILKSNNYTEN